MSVSIENLSVAYRSRHGDVTAVDNVTFTLASRWIFTSSPGAM